MHLGTCGLFCFVFDFAIKSLLADPSSYGIPSPNLLILEDVAAPIHNLVILEDQGAPSQSLMFEDEGAPSHNLLILEDDGPKHLHCHPAKHAHIKSIKVVSLGYQMNLRIVWNLCKKGLEGRFKNWAEVRCQCIFRCGFPEAITLGNTKKIYDIHLHALLDIWFNHIGWGNMPPSYMEQYSTFDRCCHWGLSKNRQKSHDLINDCRPCQLVPELWGRGLLLALSSNL